jgi:hypothetical protein
MSRIARYRWFIAGVVILILGLVFIIRITPATRPGESAYEHETSMPSRVSSVPRATRTPTQSMTPVPAALHLLQLSSDPYTNSTSQHKTEVEPASFTYGSTIVAAFQAGRFSDHGSSNIGWATSSDGGVSWQQGFLASTTVFAGGPYGRITDPSVSYDAAHNTWMIATIAFLAVPDIIASAVLVSFSTNGGTIWSKPVKVANVGSDGGLDKDWIACDNTATSRFYGNCYLEWDNYNINNLIQMSTSHDGGRTWGVAKTTDGQALGFDGYPVVQPDGTVIVPISNGSQTAIRVFTSTDGGASWSDPRMIATVNTFLPVDSLRQDILIPAKIDGAGKVYLAWVDCRFEPGCNGNDVVMTTSIDGVTWSPIQRIPIAPIGGGIDVYVASLGVDQNTSGPTAHLGLAFYYYSAHCSDSCKLSVGFASSLDGGTTWSRKTKLSNPFPLDWVAAGKNKIGDYTSLSFLGGKAFPVFALGTAPGAGDHNEAMYTVEGGIPLS